MPVGRNRRPLAAAPVAGRKPPPTARRRLGARLGSRLAAAALAGLALLLLGRSGALDRLMTSVAPTRFDWSNDYRLVEHLRDVVVQHGLTHDRKDCLLFIIDGNDPPNAARMRVMEKHSGTCPGTRGVLPLLFTLRVDRIGHSVQTDAGTPGRFHPLP